MLLLLFYLGNEIYGLDSSQVVEIIPRVNLRQLYQVPDYVAGLFNYREKFVPVVDLCQLIQNKPSLSCLSTRIIIVNYPTSTNCVQYLGLMAEKVTDTLQTNLTWNDTNNSTYKSWGKLIREEQETIQLLTVESLFPEPEQNWLLEGASQK
ncbi:chemotaxis protein CheW [Aphanothece hegewaldii CCALA 016]|uniref:Chemotaxis protein CheW n=1 Tax=Aphanothece hegewaldii CCALA 016 TaxID=2107694 RepID=A0A2T1LUN8_9CHRO|nr:chemotaxis protein CheW [Aphanothece hegewaldii]PSF35279.1 chemotaxis protein CheW [Aphanothece hegewaldii CCALA 016]